jgi:hypothetical protein
VEADPGVGRIELEAGGVSMNLQPVKIIVAGIVFTTTPAFAVPQWVEDACWHYAVRIRPALDAREREGWIASCKADYTAGSLPPPLNSRNTNRNRY